MKDLIISIQVVSYSFYAFLQKEYTSIKLNINIFYFYSLVAMDN